MQRLTALFVAVICDSGCVDERPPRPEPPLGPTGFPLTTHAYTCSGDSFVVATLEPDGGLYIFLPLDGHRLEPVRSASGARYQAGDIAFWMKGEEARLEIAGRSQPCVEDRGATLWEDAKLRGMDFRAVGNEPGWVLEIGLDRLVLVAYYGELLVTFPDPERIDVNDPPSTTYRAEAEGHHIEIRLTPGPCYDSMADAPAYGATVVIDLDGRRLWGCGSALH